MRVEVPEGELGVCGVAGVVDARDGTALVIAREDFVHTPEGGPAAGEGIELQTGVVVGVAAGARVLGQRRRVGPGVGATRVLVGRGRGRGRAALWAGARVCSGPRGGRARPVICVGVE